IARTALGDRHASFANLAVADPPVDRACSCRWTFEGPLECGIDFLPRRPCLPFVEIVHLGKHNGRWSGDGGCPRDAEVGRLQSNNDQEHDDDDSKSYEELDQHNDFSPGWVEAGIVFCSFNRSKIARSPGIFGCPDGAMGFKAVGRSRGRVSDLRFGPELFSDWTFARHGSHLHADAIWQTRT